MPTSPYERYPLIDAYVEGTLSDNEATDLLNLLQTDPNAVPLLRANVLVDFLLRENYQTKNDLQAIADQTVSESELSWDELVELQNAEKPYHVDERFWPYGKGFSGLTRSINLNNTLPGTGARYSDSGRVTSFLRKCFCPSRRDLGESIAPVVSWFLVLTAAIALVLFSFDKESEPEDSRPVFLAKVGNMIEPRWSRDSIIYQRGQLVNLSRFQLESGMIQLEMNNGTSIIATGPADFTINSAMNVSCQYGQISTHISKKATGFQILTPYGQVTDQGTEFYINVAQNQTLVDVVQGKVEFLSPDQTRFPLVEKQVIRYDTLKKATRCQPTSSYINRATFDTKVKENDLILQAEKEKINEEEDQNPNLIARYDFSKRDNTFLNRSQSGQETFSNLVASTVRWTDGELSTTSALTLSSIDDEVRLDWPGEWTRFRIKATVRLDCFAKAGNILLASDDYLSLPGTFQWQISGDGRLQFHVTTAPGRSAQFETAPLVTDAMINTWIEVTLAFDQKEGIIRHFINGQLSGINKLDDFAPLKPGRCHVGLSTENKRNFKNRFLNGAMSELKIYNK